MLRGSAAARAAAYFQDSLRAVRVSSARRASRAFFLLWARRWRVFLVLRLSNRPMMLNSRPKGSPVYHVPRARAAFSSPFSRSEALGVPPPPSTIRP